MTTDDPVCLCGDRQSEHRLGRKGCKALDCGCSAFEAADDASEKERVNRALIPVLEDNAERLRAELGEKSSSARLREVEAERDELARLVDQKQASLLESSDLLTACRARVEAVEHERDANLTANARAARKLIEERDGAAEQWAKARDRIEELEQLLADAALKLVQQQTESTAEIQRLRVLLEHAEQYACDLQDNGDVPPVELHGWDAFQCFTCGSRYRIPFDHEHPLTPVRVSITERQEHHPL